MMMSKSALITGRHHFGGHLATHLPGRIVGLSCPNTGVCHTNGVDLHSSITLGHRLLGGFVVILGLGDVSVNISPVELQLAGVGTNGFVGFAAQ